MFKGLLEKSRAGDEDAKDFKVEGGQLYRYYVGMDGMGIPGFIWKRVTPKDWREKTIMREHVRLKHLEFKMSDKP